jgi:hypothetical protein
MNTLEPSGLTATPYANPRIVLPKSRAQSRLPSDVE